MIVSKQDAASKWCPFGRLMRTDQGVELGDAVAAAVNREPNGRPLTRCIGSECMAWVWLDPAIHQGSKGEAQGCCGLASGPNYAVTHRFTAHD